MVTEAECKTTVGDQVFLVSEFLKYCNANSEKFTNAAGSHEESLLGNLQTDFHFFKQQTDSVKTFRKSLSAALTRSPGLVETGLREYGRFIDAPEADARGILGRLYKYYKDNSLLVLSRGFTSTAPAAPVATPLNTGSGLINRLSVDENGYHLDAQTPDTKTCRCVSDEHSTSRRHEEEFELVGQDKATDDLVIKGSGKRKIITALSARHSLNFIRNPSFSSWQGVATLPTSITDWEVSEGSIADFDIETTTTYRDYDGEGTETALKWTAPTAGTFELLQYFSDLRLQLTRNVPIYLQVAIYKNGTGGSGTVFLDFGGLAASAVNVADLTDNDWTVVRASTGETVGGNKENWYSNITVTGAPALTVNGNSVDVGRILYIDDVIVSPYTFFDGSWYAIVGGATKFLIDDYFTWADSSTDVGLLQYWFWRLFKAYLPHTTVTTDVTWTDPT